jgi:hypothetical protein
MGSAVGFAPCSTRLRLVCLWIPVVRCGGGMFDVAASESSGSGGSAAAAAATAAAATADDDDDTVAAVRCTIRFILFSPFFGWLSRCPLLVLLLPPLDLLDSAQRRIHCDFRVGVLVLQLVMMLLQLPTKAVVVVVVVVVSRP